MGIFRICGCDGLSDDFTFVRRNSFKDRSVFQVRRIELLTGDEVCYPRLPCLNISCTCAPGGRQASRQRVTGPPPVVRPRSPIAHLLSNLAVAALAVASRLTVAVHIAVDRRAGSRCGLVGTGTAVLVAVGQQLVLVHVRLGRQASVVRVRPVDGAGAGVGDHGALATGRVRQVAFVQLGDLARARVHVRGRLLDGARPLVRHGETARSTPTNLRP